MVDEIRVSVANLLYSPLPDILGIHRTPDTHTYPSFLCVVNPLKKTS